MIKKLMKAWNQAIPRAWGSPRASAALAGERQDHTCRDVLREYAAAGCFVRKGHEETPGKSGPSLAFSHEKGAVENGTGLLCPGRSVRLHRSRGRRVRRTRPEESIERRDVVGLRGGSALPDVSCLRANRRSLGAVEMALPARHDRWVALCRWHDPVFRKSLPSECEWGEVVGCDHATGWVSVIRGVGLHSVGCVESVSVLGHLMKEIQGRTNLFV